MDTQAKLSLLADASRFDLACACGTDDRDRRHRGKDGMWLYPVSLPSGGFSIMLKTLMSNVCVNDCKYCPYRDGVDTRRTSLDPEELAKTFMQYKRRHALRGLFLSSGVIGTPDATMDRMIAAASILRRRHKYRGFVHLKVIPGASDESVTEAAAVASALSINLETPTRASFAKLSDRKRYEDDIVRPMKTISRLTAPGERYARVGQTTQFIVGASDEADKDIITATGRLYDRLRLKRVYFSAYQRGHGEAGIPGERSPESDSPELLTREHRLYQVDFLLRKYGYAAEEIPLQDDGMLPLTVDPKKAWADAHPEFFPVRVNSADREALLRVPGLGPVTVKKILKARRDRSIRRFDAVGLKGKRLELVRQYAVAS